MHERVRVAAARDIETFLRLWLRTQESVRGDARERLNHRAPFAAFVTLALGLGILLSVFALPLEELSFRVYTNRGDLPRLALAAVLENFGYRQLLALWRCAALLPWLAGRRRTHWGEMQRSASWQRAG